MSGLADLMELARNGRLYPSTILYGGDLEGRQAVSLEVARALLCAKDPHERGCDPDSADACAHCRRLLWPSKGAERFHPDLHVLERDLRTSTSVDATKAFARSAISSPFEARGQVFVVAEAETLGGGAADALLKLLEEPPSKSPRHFMLLAASRLDLLTTLRSRSLSVFLGGASQLKASEVEGVTQGVAVSLDGFFDTGSALYLLTAAEALAKAKGWEDPRARKPWGVAASALVAYARKESLAGPARSAVLKLAEELMDAPRMRRRGIAHTRILEGLLSRHLGGLPR